MAGSDEDSSARARQNDEALKALRFMAIKAAIFILVPLACALIAVWLYV